MTKIQKLTKNEIRSVKRSARRNVAEMRQEMIDNNAVFLDWSEKIKKESVCQDPGIRNGFNTISEKGFFIFETGCILPHPYYSKKGNDGPSRFRGHSTSMKLFNKMTTSTLIRNEDGWPMQLEISHLCHWSACMNPDHLVQEPRWKNWKRLYCFGCDCNVEPKCLCKFHPSSYYEDRSNWPKQLSYTELSLIKSKLPSLVRLQPQQQYRKIDLKAANRLIRLKRKRKHDASRKRKKKSSK